MKIVFTTEELVKLIFEWEREAGEDFMDYFLHDNVKPLSWSFWLLGKGFTEHALNIIIKLERGESYFDQDELFEVYPEEEDQWLEVRTKNTNLWAEFICATASYRQRFKDFITDHEED